MTKPSYATLKSNYCTDKCPCGYANNCAIRMSRALISCDSDWKRVFKDSGKDVCSCGYIRGAQDLAAVLRKAWNACDYGWSAPGSEPSGAKGVQGVVCFMDFPGYTGQGHIDLHPGGKAHWNAKTIWLWAL
eukprot:TRINITY_DN4418_c0_g2_i1.p1 TRINITY_DN4418_c0_g2~~TRINITY_DN4418_c0_g2_i1.p1  ORF type:complete len:131 (+),score=8.87 TRINITY_DN4418_c0_g2_i1:55-447(+)